MLVALYFGAGADTDVYFYLIMVIGFGVTFMQRLNNSVLIPEAMFLAEADLSQSRRFLTLGFYFYLLLALVLCLLGLTFPAGIVGLVSRFEPACWPGNRCCWERRFFSLPPICWSIT